MHEEWIEMGNRNFVETGDILKYDLGDLVFNFSTLFPKLIEDLKE